MTAPLRLLLVPGSARARSTNTAALRTAAALVPRVLVVLERPADLPHFNPDDDRAPLPAPVAAMRERVHEADALLLSVPEYAGALPGTFKNWLDWAVGDDAPRSIAGKPAAWLNVSSRGAARAHESLRVVLGFVGATVVEAACVDLPITEAMVGDDGLVKVDAARGRLADAAGALAHAAAAQRAPHG